MQIFLADLGPRAANAARRIRASLQRRRIWVPTDAMWVEDAALCCERYLELAARYGAAAAVHPEYAEVIERERRHARAWLADVAMIPEGREHLGLVNSAGVDADVAAMCEPFFEDDT